MKYRGFILPYNCSTNKLITVANLFPITSFDKNLCNIPVGVNALWDTGATLTFMKPKLRDKLKLRMFGTGSPIHIVGVGGLVKADFTYASLLLSDNLLFEYCPVYVVDFPVKNVDIIIGMDIINMGDFILSNTENKTTFSFVVPPLPNRIDFTDILKTLNT
jgi:hypothetical protein